MKWKSIVENSGLLSATKFDLKGLPRIYHTMRICVVVFVFSFPSEPSHFDCVFHFFRRFTVDSGVSNINLSSLTNLCESVGLKCFKREKELHKRKEQTNDTNNEKQ